MPDVHLKLASRLRLIRYLGASAVSFGDDNDNEYMLC